jgi:hypothetical protein
MKKKIIKILIYSMSILISFDSCAQLSFNTIIHTYVIKSRSFNGWLKATTIFNIHNTGEYELLEYNRKKKYRTKYWTCNRQIGEIKTIGPLQIIADYKILTVGKRKLILNKVFNKEIISLRLKGEESIKPWFLHPVDGEPIYLKCKIDSTILKELVDYLILNKINEKEKATSIANFIARNIDYDYTYTKYRVNSSELFSKDKSSLCGGYSKIFKDLCGYTNIECLYTTGYTNTGVADYASAFANHAWNIVKLDSIWYGYDVTWQSGGNRNWINKDLERFTTTHFSEIKEHFIHNKIDFHQFSTLAVQSNWYESDLVLKNYTPKEKLIFSSDTFEFNTADSLIVTSISLWPEALTLPKMKMDSKGNGIKTYTAEDLLSQSKPSSSSVKIPLKNGLNSLSITLNREVSIAYIVYNGSRNEYLRHIISKASASNILDYTRAIVATVQLNDKNSYEMLTQHAENSIQFEKLINSKIREVVMQSDLTLFGCHATFDESRFSVKLNNKGDAIIFEKENKAYIPIGVLKAGESLYGFIVSN